MEIVGGFMVMMSILGLFLAVIWLIMPFVVFAIKGKQDRTLEVLEQMEKRLAALEAGLQSVKPAPAHEQAGDGCAPAKSVGALPHGIADVPTDAAVAENGEEASSSSVKTGGC